VVKIPGFHSRSVCTVYVENKKVVDKYTTFISTQELIGVDVEVVVFMETLNDQLQPLISQQQKEVRLSNAKKDAFLMQIETKEIESKDDVSVSLWGAPHAADCYVMFDSNASGASVFLDGRRFGKVGDKIKVECNKKYNARLQADGYIDNTRVVQSDGTKNFSLDLEDYSSGRRWIAFFFVYRQKSGKRRFLPLMKFGSLEEQCDGCF
jgi:hypothetical protein